MASGAKHFLKAYPPKRSSRRCASAPMRSMVDRWTNATI
jgi:hypothetical protein